jgi:DNA recombination protein RmuC
MSPAVTVLLVLVCFGAGAVIGLLWANRPEQRARVEARVKAAEESARTKAESDAERAAAALRLDVVNVRAELQASMAEVSARLQAESRRADEAAERAAAAQQAARAEMAAAASAREQAAELRTRLEEAVRAASEKQQVLESARQTMLEEFRSLAGKVVEERAAAFKEHNQTALQAILEPLQLRIREFQGKVEEVYVSESQQRSALAEQVKMLAGMNTQLSEEASRLARALRNDRKVQGNWGELVLERLLEAAGLQRDVHFEVQVARTREDATRALADVVVHLPEKRDLVIDAKVSLTDFEAYTVAENDEQRAAATKRHVGALRAHIDGLAEREYHLLPGIETLDFVVMFVPVEPAFQLALSGDADLWEHAWKRSVLLVSPSTLLFVLRTVAALWRQEQQRENALAIADRGAKLYDKLAAAVGDLQKMGTQLELARKAYDAGMNKLSTGGGNVLRQAEMLRELGVKPKKALPSGLVRGAEDDDDEDGADE